jgi:integrase
MAPFREPALAATIRLDDEISTEFRAEVDAEVDLFCRRAPEAHADAVRLARETGLRIGDLVELERSEIKKAPDGSRAIILRPNKRRRRIVNMPLTAAAEAIIDKAPLSRRLILSPKRADAWDPARLSREVREYATAFERSARSSGSTTYAGRR